GTVQERLWHRSLADSGRRRRGARHRSGQELLQCRGGAERWQGSLAEAAARSVERLIDPGGGQAFGETIADSRAGEFPHGCLLRARWRSGVVGSRTAER